MEEDNRLVNILKRKAEWFGENDAKGEVKSSRIEQIMNRLHLVHQVRRPRAEVIQAKCDAQECRELQARVPNSASKKPLPEIHAMERQHDDFLQELHTIPPLADATEVGPS